MDQAGVSELVIQAADTHQNLIDAMNQNQLDLVFCTSVAFVTQNGEYDALFQVRREKDFFSARGDLVLHRGAIIVGNRSPLFFSRNPLADLPAALERGPMAMVGSHSAAGYVYPILSIRASIPQDKLGHPPVFLGSSEEVVKSVLSGTAEVGACDASSIERVLSRQKLDSVQSRLLNVVTTTDPIPTDPILLRTVWRPATPGGSPPSVLGREIRDGVRRFFHRQPEMPRLEPASAERYREVREAVERLRSIQPAGGTTNPPVAR
jgi:ABC-type phosphate/phosphonate transport system substrate-binding protein